MVPRDDEMLDTLPCIIGILPLSHIVTLLTDLVLARASHRSHPPLYIDRILDIYIARRASPTSSSVTLAQGCTTG